MSEDEVERWQIKAYQCLENHQYEEAIRFLEKAYLLAPSHQLILMQLAQIHQTLGNREKAIELLQHHLKKNPADAQIYFYLGTLWYAENKWDAAEACFEQAIRLKADNVDAYYYLGLSYFSQGKKKLAQTAFHALLEIDAQHSGAQFQLGMLAMLSQNYRLAQSYFLKLNDRFPNHHESLVNLATCYFQMNQFKLAERCYQQAYELDKTDLQSLFNLAVLTEKKGDFKTAEKYYQQICMQDQNHAEAEHNWGVLLLKQNKKEEALIHFLLAEKSLPLAQREHLIGMLRGDALTRASKDYIEQLFEGYAPYYEKHLIEELKYSLPKQIFDAVHGLDVEKPWKLLDLGCGTGLAVEYFKSQMMYAIGVDLSQAMLDIAKHKNIYRDLYQEDIAEFLSNSKSIFNLILAADVFVYFGDLAELFYKIAERCEPLGLFAFNIEVADDSVKQYQLTQTGRFVHSAKYIEKLGQNTNWVVRVKKSITLRENRGKPVEGLIYILMRN